jgi:hydroxymethylpyrimidine pyrophosphatase-like HAD family hydrolase
VIFTIEGRERVPQVTDWLLEDGRKTGQVYRAEPFTAEEWARVQTEKVLIFDPAQDGGIEEIEALCAREAATLAPVRYGRRSIEVTEASVNKATGLTALLRYLGISPAETLVVADDQNDLEILRLAGVGAAVANATGAAKAAADYVCAGENFAGVREAVERFCFSA